MALLYKHGSCALLTFSSVYTVNPYHMSTMHIQTYNPYKYTIILFSFHINLSSHEFRRLAVVPDRLHDPWDS